MNALLTYSGLATKIRAMKRKLLTEDNFREMLAMSDVPSVLNYLRQSPGYADEFGSFENREAHRSEIELLLRNDTYWDFDKLYLFCGSDQRDFLRKYARRYEVRLIKQILNSVIDDEPEVFLPRYVDEERRHFTKYSELRFDELISARNVSGLIDALRGTRYYDTVRAVRDSEEPTLFRYETALDLALFGSFWREREEFKNPVDAEILTHIYGTKFDLLNLWYIVRAKSYYQMSPFEIYALTIPGLYRLKKGDIRALVSAETPESLERALRATYYGRKYPDLSPANLPKQYTKLCRQAVDEELRKNPYSIAALYDYLYSKEHEVYRVTTAIECVRYKLSPEEAFARVMDR